MSKRFLLACLAALAFPAGAATVPFVNVQFDVTAIAASDGLPGFDTQSGPPGETPVVASAASIGITDLATAGAIGGPGLLTTSADASAGGGIASAVSTAHFSGSFLNAGLQTVAIDFMAVDSVVGSGTAATTLFVSLTSGSTTLFQDFITGPWEFSYSLTPGTSSLLDLTLASEVSAGFPLADLGNAAGFGQVAFTASAVPLPATWLLFLVGLGALRVAVRGRTQRTPSVE